MTVFINTSLEHTVHLSFAIITMKGYINRKAILEYSDLIWVTAFSKGSCLLFQRKKTIKLSTARCGGFTCSITHGPWYCVCTGSAASIYTTVNCLDSITLFSSVELSFWLSYQYMYLADWVQPCIIYFNSMHRLCNCLVELISIKLKI